MGLEFQDMENAAFAYMDKIKLLLSPQVWENVLLDCSKNEVFIMVLLYRKIQVNMTQIAEYISVPLNTATGIVARMEKKRLVLRTRSQEDKRVVTISMTDEGKAYVQNVLKECLRYGRIILASLTPEELQTGIHIVDKIMNAFEQECEREQKPMEDKKIRKITIE